jgi:hypothetical protein
MFGKTLTGLREIYADSITSNLYTGITYNDIEGTLYNTTTNYGVSFTVINQEITNINNEIYTLGVSSINQDNHIGNLGITTKSLDNHIGQLGISSNILDSHIGLLGVSSNNQDNHLGLLGVSNYSLSISGLNTELRLQELSNEIYFTIVPEISTVFNFIDQHENRLNIDETAIYNHGVSIGIINNEISTIQNWGVTDNTRINNLELFCYGATISMSITGDAPPTIVEDIQQVVTYAQDGFAIINGIIILDKAYQSYVNGTVQTFISNQLGYNILNDTENATQNTNIATNSTAIAGIIITTAGLSTAIGILNGEVSQNTTDIAIGASNVILLNNSLNTTNDNLNDLILGTSQTFINIGTSVSTLQSQDYLIGTTLKQYTDRIKLLQTVRNL